MTRSGYETLLRELIDDLTAIRGWSQLTMRELPSDAPQQEYLEFLTHVVIQAAQRVHQKQSEIHRRPNTTPPAT